MTQINLGIFPNRSDAEAAIADLERAGLNPKEISVVVSDQTVGRQIADNTGADVASGAASGATTGGVIGGIAGLLIGIGAITIPGIGAVLIGGPIAAALGLTGAAATTATGAITGALAGGLIGALVGLGVPKDTAEAYEDRIKSGGVLLAVPDQSIGEGRSARQILEDHGADQVRTVTVDNM